MWVCLITPEQSSHSTTPHLYPGPSKSTYNPTVVSIIHNLSGGLSYALRPQPCAAQYFLTRVTCFHTPLNASQHLLKARKALAYSSTMHAHFRGAWSMLCHETCRSAMNGQYWLNGGMQCRPPTRPDSLRFSGS